MSILDSFRKMFSSREGDGRDSLSKRVKASPQDPQARQKLAAFLLKQGEVVEGLSELAKAAEFYEKGGFSAKAVAVLRQMLKHDSSNVDAQRRLIRLLAQEGLRGDAQREVEKTAASLARYASDDQKLEFYRQVAESLPGNPLPALLAADVFLSRRKIHEAVTEMERAAPGVAAAGMVPEFSARMTLLMKLAGDDAGLMESCGFLWLNAGRPEDALPVLERVCAVTRNAGDPQADDMGPVLDAIREGRISAFAGSVSFAEAARRLAAPPPPTEPEPRSAEEARSATTPEDRRIVQSAVERLQAKVQEEIGDSDLEARYNLGIAYKEMGLLEEAAEEFRLARRKPSLFLGASCLLAETLSEKGEGEEAVGVLDEVLATGTPDAAGSRDVRYQKGLILLARGGREEEAAEIFLRLFDEAPDYRDVRARTEGRRRG